MSEAVHISYADKKLIPKRATKGSAGWDFVAPISIKLEPGQELLVNTGISFHLPEGVFMMIVPRSSLGMKGLALANTVGVIDSDYQDDIKLMLVNRGKETIVINRYERFVQGILVQFFGVDDGVEEERRGGFGSTGK